MNWLIWLGVALLAMYVIGGLEDARAARRARRAGGERRG